MSEKSEHDALEVAFLAALAARQETFLARLPRLFKIGVVLVLLVLLSIPFWGGGGEVTPSSGTLAERTDSHASESPATGPHAADKKASSDPHAIDLPRRAPAQRALQRGAPKTELEIQAAERNDTDALIDHLSAVPDPELVEETTGGPLPKIGKDGRKPWQVYARPFDRSDPRPRIALVVADLGLSRIATDAALRRLPPDVTLAFDGQSDQLNAWLNRARQDGHETLLSLPMEPLDYPRSDPGPDALLTTLPNSDNIQRFLSFMKRGVGYVGVTTMTGSRFIADSGKILPIMDVLHQRGLLILDPNIAAHSVIRDLAIELNVPVAVSSRVVDAVPTPQAIDDVLSQLEQTARIEGQVVAMASPLPVTLERIELWAKQLSSHGLVLVPLSAVVE